MGKKGIVCEGGAMRGIYTAGVLDVFMENGIETDMLMGVSAGACFGCNYISGQIERTLRYNIRFAKDPRYCSFRSLLMTGDIYGYEFCYHELPEKLDPFDFESFRKSEKEFYVVATDVETGKAVYKKLEKMDREDMEWVRASASMPMVSRDVIIEGRRYLDGGIADSIPVEAAMNMGYEKNIVILTRPEGYQKKPETLYPLEKIRYRKHPEFLNTLAHRHEDYNRELEVCRQLSEEGKALIIRPGEAPQAGRIEHDTAKLTATYMLGRKDGEAALGRVKAFLRDE
ncbi:MAG: patatin family protein [Lachnospiraceae bacterium]|nr:patatin family protein [Lachnospiraceae bacterium]